MKLVLYDFQQVAVDRLASKPARFIADDLGLGKTVEAIALDLFNRREARQQGSRPGKTLVVAPLSVLGSWRSHLEKYTSHDVHVLNPKRRDLFLKETTGWGQGFYICHWEALRLKDMETLKKVNWFHIIADEAHRAKNRKAQQTRALKRLRAQYRTALTGTPAHNLPHDLWSILNWLFPKYYTSYWRFYEQYVDYQIIQPQGYKKPVGVKNELQLQKEMAPFFLRRLKQDVLKDLPDKYYTQLWVDLTPQQRKAYDEMKKHMVAWLDAKSEEELESPMVASVIVSQLTRLQQFAVAYMEQVGTVIKKDKEGKELPPMPKYTMSEPSTKLDVLMDIIEDNPDEQIVVFSQFKQIITLLARRLEKKGITYGLLTGDVKSEDRERAIDAFQDGKLRVFAGTIAAGGVGITLTAASTVVFLDRAWSPSDNRQAEDRLHRIGQANAVQVIDIIARSTVDLGRRQKLIQKAGWIQKILGDPEAVQEEVNG